MWDRAFWPVPLLWPCLVDLWPIVPDQPPSHTPDNVLLLLCCSCTFNCMFCVRRSSHVQMPHFQKRLKGATAVVLCGMVRYFWTNLAKACWEACRDYLINLTKCSATLLLAGWYKGVLNSIFNHILSELLSLKLEPLNIQDHLPRETFHELCLVQPQSPGQQRQWSSFPEMVQEIYVHPLPGMVGHGLTARRTLGGFFLYNWHGIHVLTSYSNSLSIPGHHT